MKKQFIAILASFICGVCIAQNFNQYSTSSLLNNYRNVTGGNTAFTAVNNRENTQGTRFMFNNWLKGTVVDAQGIVIKNDSLNFNFDKQSDNLVIKKDETNFISINPPQVKEFTLSDNKGTYRFKRVDAIDSSKLLLVLAENSDKYSLYKSIKTKFVKADYHTNGIAESGHEYDEYVDENAYYVLMPGCKTYKEITTKVKSLKAAFTDDKAKLFDYIGTHNEDVIDENFLIELVSYLNK